MSNKGFNPQAPLHLSDSVNGEENSKYTEYFETSIRRIYMLPNGLFLGGEATKHK